jgi:hypothetical protein
MSHESSSAENSAAEHLPPRPDSQTGEPFPPHGLSYFGGKETRPEDNPYREIRLSYKPEPPPGSGPVLAWHRENRHGKLATALAGLVILTIGAACISLLRGDGFAVLGYWQVWVIILAGTALASSPFTYLTFSAGADWLQVDHVRWGVHRRMWVDLYELKKIDASYGGTTFHLWLYDKDIGLSRSFEELQRERRIWDLVYNGILHSVANGAQVSKQAIGILKLNETSALRLRDSARPQEP